VGPKEHETDILSDSDHSTKVAPTNLSEVIFVAFLKCVNVGCTLIYNVVLIFNRSSQYGKLLYRTSQNTKINRRTTITNLI